MLHYFIFSYKEHRIVYKILFTIISIIAIIASSVYAEETATTFILSTNAFLDQGALPVLYTCDGKDVSPQFEWAGLPAKTQSLVFIMSDAKTVLDTIQKHMLGKTQLTAVYSRWIR